VDFSSDLDLAALIGQDVEVRFYAEHDDDAYGTWFYLDDLDAKLCNEWPVPPSEPGQATVSGVLRVEGDRRGGIDVWAYSHGADATYHTVALDGRDDLFPEGTYHFYNVPPGTYTIYSETWDSGLLLWDMKTVTVAGDEEQQVNLDLNW
jgi:hypothetical protein